MISSLCMYISNTMTLQFHSHKQPSILNAFLDFSFGLHSVIFFLHINPKEEDEKHLRDLVIINSIGGGGGTI